MSFPKYALKGERYIGERKIWYRKPNHCRVIRFYLAKDGHLVRRNAEGHQTFYSELPLKELLLTKTKSYFDMIIGMGNEGIYEAACEMLHLTAGKGADGIAVPQVQIQEMKP